MTHFRRELHALEFTSSPGYPYCLEASSIGDWLGWDGIRFNEEAVLRLWSDMTAFLAGDVETLYRVFVKEEPHKASKARVSRWRLIICPPLFEQMAWRLVFGPGNAKEIDTVGLTPSLQGMSLPQGNWKEFHQLFRSKDLKVPLDKTAWDWTAHVAFIDLDLELRSRLLQAEHQTWKQWKTIARQLYERAFYHPKLVMSNGTIWEQMHPGVMKSGCVNTISSNSHMQIFVHVLACMRHGVSPLPLPVAVGDDTLGCWSNFLRPENYEFTGALVKDPAEEMEFVGHRWLDSGPVPSYNAKHMFRYCMVKLEHLASYLESMVRLYAHDPELGEIWRELAVRHDVPLPSREFVVSWYDTPDDIPIYW